MTIDSSAVEDSLTPQSLDDLEIKSEPMQEVLDSVTVESPLVLPDSTR